MVNAAGTALVRRVLVTGGAGYVGAVLTPLLLKAGFTVTVLDLFIYGTDVLSGCGNNERLSQIKGDLRDQELLRSALRGCDAVIHLACVSNDPSFDLDPALGRSINLDAFEPLVRLAREAGVRRFIYASSSSVYGISDEPEVTEEHPLRPLTDYSRCKAMCEGILLRYQSSSFATVIVRPATVCGCSPRQRLDLTVNLLTCQAACSGGITVFGGSQRRPNVHIDDLAELYVRLLNEPEERVSGQIFNYGHHNYSVSELAGIVKTVVERRLPRCPVSITTTQTNDLRSYHVCSSKLARTLGIVPKRTVDDGVTQLVAALDRGALDEPLVNSLYYNVRRMRELQLR